MSKGKCYKRQWKFGNGVYQFTINPEARRVFGVLTIRDNVSKNIVPKKYVYKAGITCSKDDEWDPVVGISVCMIRLSNMRCDIKGNEHFPNDQDGNGWYRFKEWARSNYETRTDEVSEVDTVHDRRGVSNPGTKGKRITVTPTRSPEEVQRNSVETPYGRLFFGGADFGESGEVVILREDDETIHEQLVRDIEKAGEDLEEGVTGH